MAKPHWNGFVPLKRLFFVPVSGCRALVQQERQSNLSTRLSKRLLDTIFRVPFKRYLISVYHLEFLLRSLYTERLQLLLLKQRKDSLALETPSCLATVVPRNRIKLNVLFVSDPSSYCHQGHGSLSEFAITRDAIRCKGSVMSSFRSKDITWFVIHPTIPCDSHQNHPTDQTDWKVSRDQDSRVLSSWHGAGRRRPPQ